MNHFVSNFSKENQQGDMIKINTFKFNTETETKVSIFEMFFCMIRLFIDIDLR